MSSIWQASKATNIPIHENLTAVDKLPWTIGFVIRKLAQVESFKELPRDKRPPDDIVWWGSAEDIEKWFDKVLDRKEENPDEAVFIIEESEIEN